MSYKTISIMNKKRLKELLETAIQTNQEKDKKAFQAYLYEECFELLYSIVKNRFPYNADDVFGDLFCYRFLTFPLSVYKESFKYLNQFLIRCAINFCNTAYKKKSKKELLEKNYGMDYMNKQSNLILKASEIMLDLNRILKKIPTRQQKVFLLHCYLGYKHIEIVDICEDVNSESISKQLLYRAKRNLKRYFFQ